MGAAFSVVLGWLATTTGKMFVDRLIMFLALKVFVTAIFMVAVPIILNNVFHSFIEIIMNFSSAQVSGGGTFDGSMNFSGFAAYLIDVFNVAQCFAVLISAIQLRLALSMIPFVNFGR